MRKRIVTIGGAASVAVFDSTLRAHCAALGVQCSVDLASQSLCDLALCDLPRSINCQAELARCAALTELIFGSQGGPAASACVATWMKQLTRAESALQRTLRTLEAQSDAWHAAQANLARADETRFAQVTLVAALTASDKFKGFVEGKCRVCVYVCS